MSDDLTLLVRGMKLSGWKTVRVTRGIERFPSDFDIGMTERFPGEINSFVVKPGDQCQVLIGSDVVVTGYIDRVAPSVDTSSHSIRVIGRGKCADLVDCAAEWPGGQISGASILQIAQKLVEPYGIFSDGTPENPIRVLTDIADIGPTIPQQNLILGTTPWSLIESMCRYCALLAYEDADGNLLLTRAGTEMAASGIVEGKNMQSATMEYSVDQRYSEVCAYIQSVDTFQDVGELGNLQFIAADPNINRHRKMVVLAEAGDSHGFPVLKKRTEWEVARRMGRGFALHTSVDSWRDAAGVLWAPNTLAPISIPSLKLISARWLISEVTYSRNGSSGTTADLVLMPREAFLPQPVVLMPGFSDVIPQARQ